MRKRIHILCLLLAAFCCSAQSQITISYLPAADSYLMDRLAAVQISSSLTSVTAVCTVTARRQGVKVLTVKTRPFVLVKGNNRIPYTAFAGGSFNFAGNSEGHALAQSRRFIDGSYEFCFEIKLLDAKDPLLPEYYDQCTSLEIERVSPMLLLSPADREMDCNKRPLFIWQPPFPAPVGTKYFFVLAELLTGQTSAEALSFNKPELLRTGIAGTLLQYPSDRPELREDKNYVWQVTAVHNGTIVSKSEIWNYRPGCEQSEQPVKKEFDSYRELNSSPDGASYYTDQWIRFAITNPYESQALQYELINLTRKGESIKESVKLQMTRGYNKYELDAQKLQGVQPGDQLRLIVTMPDRKKYLLDIIYVK
jgi:hypothetical protein